MKSLIAAFLLVSFTAAPVIARQKQRSPFPKPMSERAKRTAPKFQFTGGDTKEIGNISDQESVVVTYEFTNVGKKPLVISSANASCGCTIPEIPKAPVLPGQKGTIKVTFNPAGKAGPVQKTIYIVSNAVPNREENAPYEIYLSAAILPGMPVNHPAPATGAAKN